MRKLAIILLFIALTLSAITIGCSDDNNGTLATTPGETSDNETTNAISGEDASNHIGERVTVYGPVVDTHYASTSNGQPTFLNIGKSYPASDRFTIVIWGSNRHKFPSSPETYYSGKTVYVTGLITTYKGAAQIEASSPSQIAVK